MTKCEGKRRWKNTTTTTHIHTFAAHTFVDTYTAQHTHILYTRMQTYHPNKSMAVNNEAPKKAVIQFNNIIAKMRFVHMLNFTWVFPWFHQKQSTYSKCHHNDKPSCWRRMGRQKNIHGTTLDTSTSTKAVSMIAFWLAKAQLTLQHSSWGRSLPFCVHRSANSCYICVSVSINRQNTSHYAIVEDNILKYFTCK